MLIVVVPAYELNAAIDLCHNRAVKQNEGSSNFRVRDDASTEFFDRLALSVGLQLTDAPSQADIETLRNAFSQRSVLVVRS